MKFDRRNRRAGVAAFWVSGLFLMGPLPARASRMTTVVHGVGAGSDKAAALSGHYVRELFSRDERYEVVDLGKALGNQDRDRALRAFQAAEEMVQKGREAYDTLELDAAVEYLTNTLAKYERYAAYVADFKKVSEALMLLGATHILRGEEKLGAKRLEQAINVYPQAEPDPRIFNPAMRSLFQESVSRANGRPPGALSVSSNPSYSEVYVDGKFVGVTPLAIDHVSEGRHYVRLEKDGYRAWGKVVDVAGRAETAESAQLKPTARFDDFDNLVENAVKHLTPPSDGAKGGMSNDSIGQLATLTNADQIFLAQVRLDGERVQIWANQYDLTAQRLLHAAEHVFPYDSRPEVYEREVATMLHDAFGADTIPAVAAASAARPAATNKKDKRPAKGDEMPHDDGLLHAGQTRCIFGLNCQTVKIALLAGGVGLGAVSAGLGIWQWTVAKHDHNTFVALPQVAAFTSPAYTEGRNAALAGDILVGAGIVVALSGLATYIWWDPAPSASDVLDDTHGASTTKASLDAVVLPGWGMVQARLQF